MVARGRYLFIRILEACNADCFMCDFALSRDHYRFTVAELEELLPKAKAAGVRYVRFTGGEPLMHREILELVQAGAMHAMKMSLITNGVLLPRMIHQLAEAGLAHIVVSLDGGSAQTHDVYRRLPNAFDNGLAGLREAHRLGLVTRVNTVVGPHNYAEMPQLQRILTEAAVQQWELSALKLERHIVYPEPDHVLAVCEPVYRADPKRVLVPLGKRFYGDTPEERERFFTESVTPRASRPLCHVVDDVVYIDAKRGRGYACPCIAHREEEHDLGSAMLRHGAIWEFDTPAFRAHADFYRVRGPVSCTGCTTTAAGYSDDVERLTIIPAWHG
jgi:cytosylglucuronate decarboxylase